MLPPVSRYTISRPLDRNDSRAEPDCEVLRCGLEEVRGLTTCRAAERRERFRYWDVKETAEGQPRP